jgi:hypothetical protein
MTTPTDLARKLRDLADTMERLPAPAEGRVVPPSEGADPNMPAGHRRYRLRELAGGFWWWSCECGGAWSGGDGGYRSWEEARDGWTHHAGKGRTVEALADAFSVPLCCRIVARRDVTNPNGFTAELVRRAQLAGYRTLWDYVEALEDEIRGHP